MADLIIRQLEEDSFACEICQEFILLPNKRFTNSNGYIRVKLEDNVSDIKCPHISCSHSLDPLSCRNKIAHQLFNKWCDVLCESTLLGFDKVYCPNNECSELIMNEFGDADVKRCVCPSCLKPLCYKCMVPWHDGYTCEETRDGNNVDFDVVCKTNRWNWKRCPKCRYYIQFIGGCNTVKCRCGTQFCYRCGKQVPFWHSFDFVYQCCTTNENYYDLNISYLREKR